MHLHLLLLSCLLASSSSTVRGYCWGAGKNPGFSSKPRVTQLALDRVRVSWRGLVTQEECADNYVVKYWPRHSPGEYDITRVVPRGTYEVEVEVTPKLVYQFQAVAREEKGVIGGVDWNKSPSTSFRTSKGGDEVEEDVAAAPTEDDPPAQAVGRAVTTATSSGNKNRRTVLGLGLEVFVVVVVLALLLVLVVVGLLYRIACGGKRVHDDDEEEQQQQQQADDDDGDEEKRQLDPEKNGL